MLYGSVQAGVEDHGWPAPDTIRVMFWLKSGLDIEGAGVACFSETMRIHKPQHILVNSTTYGPIGVKDVVDALRIAPDEPPCDEVENLARVSGLLLVNPGDLVHVVWEPDLPGYSFYLDPWQSGIDCGELPDFPPFDGPVDFLIPGDLGIKESIRIFRRPGTGTLPDGIEIGLSQGCVN